MSARRLLIWAVLVAVAFPAMAQAPAAKKPAGTTTPKTPPASQQKPGAPAPWKQIPIPPLAPFHPQAPKRIQLANGMVIFLQEDHELPLVGGTARIRGGSRAEPSEKTGLIDIYGDVWRTGGTTNRTGDQLDDFLEARAASIETGGGGDSTSISFNTLRKTFDEVFPIFLELLRQPSFREDKIKLAKTQMNTVISRRNDDIGSIAGREALRLAYGKENPYARIPEYASVAAITRDDLVKWHDTYVHPNNMIVGIWGDFDSAQMEQRLRQAFESWPKAEVPPAPRITFSDPKPGIYFIEKEDVNQSAIRMVTLGIERNNPDYFTVEVMNEVLGGGFSSRLFKAIRTEKGLAYSVGGGIGAAFDHPGIFRVAMGTKSGSTVDAINALYEELRNMTIKPVTEEEIRDAKDSILNRFIFNFDSKSKVLAERMLYEFYGYPADFLERYRAGVEKATPNDVDRVAKKYIHEGQFAVLVVGNQKEFVKPLTTLGQVKPIDITIPEPGAEAAKPGEGAEAKPAQTDPKAKAFVEKFVTFAGGAAKVDAVKSVQFTAISKQNTPQGEITFNASTLIVFPDTIRQVMKAEQMPGEMVVVVSPSTSFMSMPGAGTRDMPGSLRAQALDSVKRDWIWIAQHANDPAYVFTLGGTEKVGDAQGQTIKISGGGVALDWTIDPQSGQLLRVSYDRTGPQGPSHRVITYSDWRPAGNLLTAPFKRSVTENGEPTATDQFESYQFNVAVDAKLFEKPAEAKPGPQ